MSEGFDILNKQKYEHFLSVMNETIKYGSPPLDSAEFIDFVQDWLDFKKTHKRSNKYQVLLDYKTYVEQQFQRHDHSQEWNPPRLAEFHKTGRKPDPKLMEMNRKIQELHDEGKTRPEIIAHLRRRYPERRNFSQDIIRVLGPAKL